MQHKKEYKTMHDWVGKVIHWELCNELKFDHADNWYMHKPESVLKMRRIKFSGILRYKRITQFRTEGQT